MFTYLLLKQPLNQTIHKCWIEIATDFAGVKGDN